MDSVLIVLVTLPETEAPEPFAARLLEEGLAACVNVLPAVQSLFRWEGAIQTASEKMLMIKTTTRCYARLEAAIQEMHPYDVPEIVAIPVTAGLPAYLAWVNAETGNVTNA